MNSVTDPINFVENNRALLASLPLFEGIPFERYQPFLHKCEYKQLKSGDTLISPGVLNEYLHVLLEGELSIYIGPPHSSKPIALPVNEFVGEVSIVDGQLPTGHVTATQESLVLSIHGDLMWREFFKLDGVAKNYQRQIAKRMRDRNNAMRESVEHSVRLEYLEKELRVARDLQSSMLPMAPLLEGFDNLDAAALMIPANEVGGDFYDAFVLDEDKVCIAIGDVSGKGFPAALFMARCVTILRIEMMQTDDLLESIHAINELLCKDNPTCMFVTLMICVIDIRKSRLQYVNAGHNPALYGNDEKGFRFLRQPHGILAGIDPNAKYKLTTADLKPNRTLILYTDGITEAMNSRLEPFAEERLTGFLNAQSNQSAEALIEGLKKEVELFVDGARQSDDLTILALRFKGKN